MRLRGSSFSESSVRPLFLSLRYLMEESLVRISLCSLCFSLMASERVWKLLRRALSSSRRSSYFLQLISMRAVKRSWSELSSL